MKTVNNFNASQRFGLYDIFNYVICSPELIAGSTLRFKRALATAYSSVDLPVWRSSVRRVLAKANFLASLFVCFSFARCLPFTIESRHLGMVYIFIPKTKQWYKRMTELTYPFFTSYSRYGIRIQFHRQNVDYKRRCLSCTRTSHLDDMTLSTLAFPLFV